MPRYLERFEDAKPHLIRTLPPSHVQYKIGFSAGEEAVYDFLSDAKKDLQSAELSVTGSDVEILCGRPIRPESPGHSA